MLGDKIKWNFTKFLVGGRHRAQALRLHDQPEKIAADIEKALAA